MYDFRTAEMLYEILKKIRNQISILLNDESIKKINECHEKINEKINEASSFKLDFKNLKILRLRKIWEHLKAAQNANKTTYTNICLDL